MSSYQKKNKNLLNNKAQLLYIQQVPKILSLKYLTVSNSTLILDMFHPLY